MLGATAVIGADSSGAVVSSPALVTLALPVCVALAVRAAVVRADLDVTRCSLIPRLALALGVAAVPVGT